MHRRKNHRGRLDDIQYVASLQPGIDESDQLISLILDGVGS
jgi:hypothetical protein